MKSFRKNEEKQKTNGNAESKSEFDAQEAINSLAGKSETELYSQLFSLAAKGRSEGTLNDQTIEEFRKKLAPMLSEEQAKKLDAILQSLKQ